MGMSTHQSERIVHLERERAKGLFASMEIGECGAEIRKLKSELWEDGAD